MYKNIVIPLDTSELAEKTLQYIRHLATSAQCRLILVSTIEPFKYTYASISDNPAFYGTLLESVEKGVVDYLAQMQNKLQGDGYTVVTHITHGDAAQSIVDVAAKEHADLIAMTTHGRSGFARWALGSVADRVVRTAHQPVLLIRSRMEDAPHVEMQKILVPLDGSSLAEKALAQAESIAQKRGATLHLVRVLEPLSKWERQILYAGNNSSDSIAIERADEARAYLDAIVRRLQVAGIKSEQKLYSGSAAQSILDASEAAEIDLIVMSTHGYGGYTRWVYGSVANQLLHSAPCPLLVLRSTEGNATDLPAIEGNTVPLPQPL